MQIIRSVCHTCAVTVDAAPGATHPLDLLTAQDVAVATAILRADPRISDVALVVTVIRFEPAKAELLSFAAGGPVDVRVRYQLYDRAQRAALDVVVSLSQGYIIQLDTFPGAHPPYLMFGDMFNAAEAARADPRFIAGCLARGVKDVSLVQLDPWPAGRFGQPWETHDDGSTRRVCRVLGYARDDLTDNGYAHPLDGLIATVCLDTMVVLDVTDVDAKPYPVKPARYDTLPARGTATPISITQPDGPAFTLDGNHITWEKWRLRFSLHPVTGLVLHQVTYDGRSIAHRLSVSEMVVPYAGDTPNTWWKNTFDAGELCMGKFVNSLALGCDCLGEITYLDAVFSDETGNPYTIPQAICLHEEDAGLAWKHTDLHSGTVAVRRARRFVINCVITAGNYEYAFRWMLHTDGRLQLEIQLTGIVQTERADDDGSAPHATRLIMEGLAAANHQHIFCARLDLDIDGTANTVIESDVMAVDRPAGHAWDTLETVLRSELQAVRDYDGNRGRRWKIQSSARRNAVGAPTAYELNAHPGPPLLARADSSVAQRAGFARHALWVTAHDDAQLHAASDHANLHPGGAGLPAWVQADRPLVEADVVLWHSFGATHVVRPEDWPIMPVETCGFTLRPVGFFDTNPAMDLDPPTHCHHG
jgi:primary-amine oxidase